MRGGCSGRKPILTSYCNYKTKTVHVTGLITAPIDSWASSTQFIRGHFGLAEQISEIEKKSGGQLGYIGEWHTHPNGASHYSITDLNAMIETVSCETVQIKNPILLILSVTKNSVRNFTFYYYDNEKLISYEQ